MSRLTPEQIEKIRRIAKNGVNQGGYPSQMAPNGVIEMPIGPDGRRLTLDEVRASLDADQARVTAQMESAKARLNVCKLGIGGAAQVCAALTGLLEMPPVKLPFGVTIPDSLKGMTKDLARGLYDTYLAQRMSYEQDQKDILGTQAGLEQAMSAIAQARIRFGL